MQLQFECYDTEKKPWVDSKLAADARVSVWPYDVVFNKDSWNVVTAEEKRF